MHPLRREVPRQPADWFGFYRFASTPNDRWRCCRVIDISPLGAGLELLDVKENEEIGGLISVSLELRGETRSLVMAENGESARVGVTFPLPTDSAKEYVRSLSGVRSRW